MASRSRKANRKAVLNGWLTLINDATELRLTQGQVNAIPYQLIHRTASVFSLGSESRAVIYLVFKGPSLKTYVSGISALAQLMQDVCGFKFCTIECVVTSSFTLKVLETDWDNGEREMARRVRAALKGGPLYAFGVPKLSIDAT